MNMIFEELQPYTSEEQFFHFLMTLLVKALWETALRGREAEVDLQG